MHQVAAVTPLAYLLALAEDPCTWLFVLWIGDRVIIPAWKRWRAKRKGREVTENLG